MSSKETMEPSDVKTPVATSLPITTDNFAIADTDKKPKKPKSKENHPRDTEHTDKKSDAGKSNIIEGKKIQDGVGGGTETRTTKKPTKKKTQKEVEVSSPSNVRRTSEELKLKLVRYDKSSPAIAARGDTSPVRHIKQIDVNTINYYGSPSQQISPVRHNKNNVTRDSIVDGSPVRHTSPIKSPVWHHESDIPIINRRNISDERTMSSQKGIAINVSPVRQKFQSRIPVPTRYIKPNNVRRRDLPH